MTGAFRALLAKRTEGPWATRPSINEIDDLTNDIIAKGCGNLTVASDVENDADAETTVALQNMAVRMVGLLDDVSIELKGEYRGDQCSKRAADILADLDRLAAGETMAGGEK